MGITYVRTAFFPAAAPTVGSLCGNHKLLKPIHLFTRCLTGEIWHVYECVNYRLCHAKDLTQIHTMKGNNYTESKTRTCKQFWMLFFILPKTPHRAKGRYPICLAAWLLLFLHLESLGLLTRGSGTLRTEDCFVWPSVFINICIVNFIILQSALGCVSWKRLHIKIPTRL